MDRKTDRFPIFYFWIVFPIIYNHISLKLDFQKFKRSFFLGTVWTIYRLLGTKVLLSIKTRENRLEKYK